MAKEAIEWARAEGRPSIMATFDPHPVRFFKPDAAPFRLTTLEQRQELYLAAGATADNAPPSASEPTNPADLNSLFSFIAKFPYSASSKIPSSLRQSLSAFATPSPQFG